MYKNKQDKEISLNRGYDKIRIKLYLAKIYDLTNKDYDNEKEKNINKMKLKKTPTQYVEDSDNLF